MNARCNHVSEKPALNTGGKNSVLITEAFLSYVESLTDLSRGKIGGLIPGRGILGTRGTIPPTHLNPSSGRQLPRTMTPKSLQYKTRIWAMMLKHFRLMAGH